MQPYGATPAFTTARAPARYSSQVATGRVGIEPSSLDKLAVPALDDDIEQEWPGVQVIVKRRLRPHAWQELSGHVRRDILVPRLNDSLVDEAGQLDPRRHAHVHVPRARVELRLLDEVRHVDATRRSDHRGQSGGCPEDAYVHFTLDVGMKVDHPVLEDRRERRGTFRVAAGDEHHSCGSREQKRATGQKGSTIELVQTDHVL